MELSFFKMNIITILKCKMVFSTTIYSPLEHKYLFYLLLYPSTLESTW